MNKAELINAVAASAGYSKKDAEAIISATLDTITAALKEGDKVQLVGFGSFETKKRAARIGRNPKTKESIGQGGARVSRRCGARTGPVEVRSVQETVKQADASALYREVREE